MENQELRTPSKVQTNSVTHKSPVSGNSFCISGTPPNRLTVPGAFKYPERYKSPTDQVMSPITKGLLARSRKARNLLPPIKNQNKIQDMILNEVGNSQT